MLLKVENAVVVGSVTFPDIVMLYGQVRPYRLEVIRGGEVGGSYRKAIRGEGKSS